MHLLTRLHPHDGLLKHVIQRHVFSHYPLAHIAKQLVVLTKDLVVDVPQHFAVFHAQNQVFEHGSKTVLQACCLRQRAEQVLQSCWRSTSFELRPHRAQIG